MNAEPEAPPGARMEGQDALVQELRTTLGQMELALAAVPDAIVWTGGDGGILWCNAAFDRLVGGRHVDVLGRRLSDLLPLEQAGERVRSGLPAPSGMYELARPGGRVTLELISNSFRSGGGDLSVVTVLRDVTRRREAEEAMERQRMELARSNAELDQFAYVASHDLQEPLRKVASFAELLGRKYRGRLDPEGDKYIHYVVDGATRMQALIQSLLEYSRVGRREAVHPPSSASAALAGVLADLEPAIRETRATVTSDALPTVPVDPLELKRLFQNLIGNALKFHGEPPPKIHVSARRVDGGWEMSVSDNGIGIEPQYAEKIFGMFQRLHGRSDYPGSGMGLAICRKIVERAGGRIWVESTPGQGSAFRFIIPDRVEAGPPETVEDRARRII